MVCPSCGETIEEGKLLCPKCGTEIQIVPEFDPILEDSIIVGDKKDADETEGVFENDNDDINKSGIVSFLESKNINKLAVIVAVCVFLVVCIVGIVIGVVSANSKRNNPDNIFKNALEARNNENYELSIEYLKKAIEQESNNAEYVLTLAEVYQTTNEYDLEIELLDEACYSERFDDTDKKRLFVLLINALELKKDYRTLNKLLSECEYEDIKTLKLQYLSLPPVFSVKGGEYDESFKLCLTSDITGSIYYTTDGSEPSDRSYVYTNPIELGSGNHIIRAFFVNQYGIQSEIAQNDYKITESVVPMSEVYPESGEYEEALNIEILDADESFYYFYTIDGSDPDKNSRKYTGPISMPLGESIFKFIAVSPEGICSEIMEREYNLTVNAQISADQAGEIVKAAMISTGLIVDESGKKIGAKKYLTYASQVINKIGASSYYVVYEYEQNDIDAPKRLSGNVYAVNINDGSVYHLLYDELNNAYITEL